MNRAEVTAAYKEALRALPPEAAERVKAIGRGELIEERHAEPRGEMIPRGWVEAQLVPLTHRLSAGGLNAEERAKGWSGDWKQAAPDTFDLNKLDTATIEAMAEKSLNALPLKARAQVERLRAAADDVAGGEPPHGAAQSLP